MTPGFLQFIKVIVTLYCGLGLFAIMADSAKHSTPRRNQFQLSWTSTTEYESLTNGKRLTS